MPVIVADDPLFKVIPIPRAEVTHWGISRMVAGKWDRLEFADDAGLTPKEWPIDQLTYETIKARWASGEFKLHYFENEPEHADPHERRRSGGHSAVFKVQPETATRVPTPHTSHAAAGPPTGVGMGEAFAFAMQLVELSERRAQSQIEATLRMAGVGTQAQPTAALEAVAEMRAEMARMKAEAEALRLRDEADRRHRTEIARLERERDDARREADEEDDEPSIVAPDGAGFLAQIGAGIANAMVEAAKKNPELVMGVLGSVAAPIIAKMGGAAAEAATQAPTPPPTGNAPPRQVAPAPAVAEPVTLNGMCSTPMSPSAPTVETSSAPAAVAAVEKTRSGVLIQRAPKMNGTNGAAPSPVPAVIDVAAVEVRS